MHARLRSFAAMPLMGLIALGGCSVSDTLGLSSSSSSTTVIGDGRTSGLAVADEPYAARAGAGILGEGGSAADAASAMFFTLTVTYPAAASMGGGGICLVRDAGGQLHELDFLARNAAGGGAFAVPGAVHGFYDMQHAYGSLPWQRTVAPAEALAATGFPMSAALAARLGTAQNQVRLDAALAAEFLDESGQPRAQGAILINRALAATLGAVRLGGTDGFYKGDVAQRLSAYAASQGGAISVGDLAGYVTAQDTPRQLSIAGAGVVIPGPRTGAGAFLASMMSDVASAAPSAQAAGDAVRRSLGRFGIGALPHDLGSTGFAAVDANGQAVSCVVTMGGAFGSAHTAEGTGVTLAPSPSGDAGLANAFLAPMLAVQDNNLVLAGAGAGGPNGAAALGYAIMKVARGQAMGHPGDLSSTGTAPYDTVNLIACQSVCVALSDPGANGLGAVAPPIAPPVAK